jgi:iron complex transport system substrate-binding protein
MGNSYFLLNESYYKSKKLSVFCIIAAQNNHTMPIYFLLLCCLFFTACNNDRTTTVYHSTSKVAVKLAHANNFTIEKEGVFTILSIKTAWKNAQEEFQYVLYPKGTKPPSHYLKAVMIPVPVERIICTSTVDIAFLDFLGATDKIVAVSNSTYVYNKNVQERVAQGAVIDIGGNNIIDYERALTTNADVALVYSIGDQKAYQKFNEMGVPAILLSDFMEKTPLGRAEWAIFVACLLGKEVEAQEKCAQIAAKYQALQAKVKNYAKKPTVLTGAVYKGTWYIAGGKSLMATLIRDAGGAYLWAENESLSGVPLDFEAVYAKGLNADRWINMSNWTNKADLGQSEEKYQDFKAFQEGQLYNFYKRVTENGGVDIFESGIVKPHLVLKDFVHLLHDEQVHSDSLYYYQAL